MTLLEAMLALVILGLSAVGVLDVMHTSADGVRAAREWTRASAVAEATMEAALLGDALQAQDAMSGEAVADSGWSRRLEVRAGPGRLADLVVTVTTPRGVRFELHRLAAVPGRR
jgi:Tfp pilus assembly protein PilV